MLLPPPAPRVLPLPLFPPPLFSLPAITVRPTPPCFSPHPLPHHPCSVLHPLARFLLPRPTASPPAPKVLALLLPSPGSRGPPPCFSPRALVALFSRRHCSPAPAVRHLASPLGLPRPSSPATIIVPSYLPRSQGPPTAPALSRPTPTLVPAPTPPCFSPALPGSFPHPHTPRPTPPPPSQGSPSPPPLFPPPPDPTLPYFSPPPAPAVHRPASPPGSHGPLLPPPLFSGSRSPTPCFSPRAPAALFSRCHYSPALTVRRPASPLGLPRPSSLAALPLPPPLPGPPPSRPRPSVSSFLFQLPLLSLRSLAHAHFLHSKESMDFHFFVPNPFPKRSLWPRHLPHNPDSNSVFANLIVGTKKKQKLKYRILYATF